MTTHSIKHHSVNILCPLCHGPMQWVQYEFTHEPVRQMERGLLDTFTPGDSSATLELVCSCGGTMHLQHPLLPGVAEVQIVEDGNGSDLILGPKPEPAKWPDIYEVYAMRTCEVRFERVKNLGNYESERVGVSVEVDDGDDPVECLHNARRFVNRQLGLGPTDDQVAEARRILEEADDDEWTG